MDVEEEIRKLRTTYYKQCDLEKPSPRLQFEYASLLSCSPSKEDVREALELLAELLEVGYNRGDCLYQTALADMKLGNYGEARRNVELLLKLEPRNLAALSLHSLILNRTSYDGLVGAAIMALVGIAATTAGLVIYRRWRAS